MKMIKMKKIKLKAVKMGDGEDNDDDEEDDDDAVTLKSQSTLPLVNLVNSTATSSTCSAMSPSLKFAYFT